MLLGEYWSQAGWYAWVGGMLGWFAWVGTGWYAWVSTGAKPTIANLGGMRWSVIPSYKNAQLNADVAPLSVAAKPP